MKKLFLAAFVLVSVLAFSPAAKATPFDFGFFGTGGDSTLAGVLSYNIGSNGFATGGTLDITTAGGPYTTGIYTLVASESFSFGPVTELVFQNGLSTIDIFNLGSGGGWQIELNESNITNDFLNIYGPEPSSLLLLGSGLLILAAGIFWKSRTPKAGGISGSPQTAIQTV